METVILQILAQSLNIEAGHVIDGLLGIIGVILLILLNDMKGRMKEQTTTMKETHALFLDHDRRITRLEAKDE